MLASIPYSSSGLDEFNVFCLLESKSDCLQTYANHNPVWNMTNQLYFITLLKYMGLITGTFLSKIIHSTFTLLFKHTFSTPLHLFLIAVTEQKSVMLLTPKDSKPIKRQYLQIQLQDTIKIKQKVHATGSKCFSRISAFLPKSIFSN